MNPETIKRLKELAVTAIFSDDDLFNLLVLKGGNALDLIYGISQRSSFDLDFSISGQFDEDQLETVERQLRQAIEREFKSAGYQVFDFKFKERPDKIADDVKHFWGGYAVEFKFIEEAKYQQLKHNKDKLRRNAKPIGKNRSTKMEIDISKFEFCDDKELVELNDYHIYVYSYEMLVFEKLRAICQQTTSYGQVIKTHHPRARARDFYDIFTLMQHRSIDVNTDKNRILLKKIFEAKKAKLSVAELNGSKELHRSDFESLKATLPANAELKSFDEYFDFVVAIFGPLESLWNE